MCDHIEADRRSFHKISVAHPAYALFRDIPEQHVFLGINKSLSIFTAVLGTAYLSLRHVRHKLDSVADSENRDSKLKYLRVIVRRGLIINAVRTSCENNALVSDASYLISRNFIIRLYFRIYMLFTDSACNKLIVLTSEIQNQYFFCRILFNVVFHRLSFLFMFSAFKENMCSNSAEYTAKKERLRCINIKDALALISLFNFQNAEFHPSADIKRDKDTLKKLT